MPSIDENELQLIDRNINFSSSIETSSSIIELLI
jgi:hypothetical protein